jgi:carbon storage regulator
MRAGVELKAPFRRGGRPQYANQLKRHGGNAMLVLTRRLGQEIVIDGGIRITVLEVKGNQVRLGITAPPSVVVDREEVHARRARWEAPADLPLPSAKIEARPRPALLVSDGAERL